MNRVCEPGPPDLAGGPVAALLDALPAGVCTCDATGAITGFNPRAVELWGRRPAPGERCCAETAEVLRTGEPRRNAEVVTGRPDGSRVTLIVNIDPMLDAEGRVIGAIQSFHDAGALAAGLGRRMGERGDPGERTEDLREALAELEAFTYTVAHDLRAPLRAIHGYTQIVQQTHDTALPAQARDMLRRVAAASRRMDQLITDLLAYSHVSRDEMTLAELDLGAVVDTVVHAMHAEIAEKGARVAVLRPLHQVWANRVTLEQVVTNLVGNAIKFVPAGKAPEVRIHSESVGGRARLWVEDNGIGIAGVHLSKLFTLFERLHAREEYPGTGIGLAIVRRATERMGGAAGVESEPGRGSRFWVELGLQPEANGARRTDESLVREVG